MSLLTDPDILETIAEVLTSKFKKELIHNLQPYTQRIRDGEKYQRIIMQLLESLPEYVELRDKYNTLLQENELLKTSSTNTTNITLEVDDCETKKVELTRNINTLVNVDENIIVKSYEDKKVEEEETIIVKKEDNKSSKEQNDEEYEEVTDDEQEEEEEEEYDEVTDDEEVEYEEVTDDENEEEPTQSGKRPTTERKVPIS